jgi:RHS repeat-associated protein
MGSGLAETSAPIMRSDGRGNQSVEQWPDGSTITVAYDGFARLTRYKVGVATQDMLYNGDDERIRVVTTPAIGPSDTRIYVYDLDHRIVGEYGGTGITDIKAEYIWTLPEVDATGPTGGDDGTGGYMPLAIVKGSAGEINWVHSHHNGKPLLMTNVTGAIVPYSGHAVLGFPGQFANAVGLAGAQYYYNRHRDYNDTTGRYIQADPIGLAGDANPYAYAMGNTLRYSDPMGLAPVCNFSNRPILVGGTSGSGHGHPRSGDRWTEYTLPAGQCVSKWQPRMGNNGPLSDVDAIDLNCDGIVNWPGTQGLAKKFWEYAAGEAFRGSDTASGGFRVVENQFVVLRTAPNGRRYPTFEMLGPGPHGR